jgi:hypothetical protein
MSLIVFPFSGPLINKKKLDKIAGLVAHAQDQGAWLLLGEPVRGLVMPPRRLDGVRPDMWPGSSVPRDRVELSTHGFSVRSCSLSCWSI